MTRDELAKLAVDAHARSAWALKAAKDAVRAGEQAVLLAEDAAAFAVRVREAVCVLAREPYAGPGTEHPDVIAGMLTDPNEPAKDTRQDSRCDRRNLRGERCVLARGGHNYAFCAFEAGR